MMAQRKQIVQSLLLASALPITLLVFTAVTSERIVVEKLLTYLVMPLSLFWLALWGAVCCAWSFGLKRVSYWGLGAWMGFTIITSPLTSYFLASRLERDISDFRVEDLPKFRAIIVLGGGTTESPLGRAGVGGAGERVMLAARLYHLGKAEQLVATGKTIESLRRSTNGRRERDGAEQTKDIWMGLQIPEASILTMGGRNTREEMAEIKKWLLGLPQDSKIGLITSAWHLPRALRLAKSQGVDVVPLPADFSAGRPPAHLIELLPSGGSAGKLEVVLKEYLAWLLGR